MTIRIGMAVNISRADRLAGTSRNYVPDIVRLANALEAVIPYADACDFWFDGRPAVSTFSALVLQLRETIEQNQGKGAQQ